MPALDSGDVRAAQAKARRNVAALLPWVDRGYAIAVVNPTCCLMMRQEYADLLDDPADPGCTRRRGAWPRRRGTCRNSCSSCSSRAAFHEDFQSTPNGNVAYHAPCHLRMQNVGFRGRDLMRRIPGVKPKLVAECCGHDGTWAMKTENFAASLKNGEKAFDGMREANAEIWTSDCPLAALQFQQACGKYPLHPVEVLDRAYREDGFATAVAVQPTPIVPALPPDGAGV